MVRGGRRAARARARRREREARNFPPFEPAFAVDIGGSCEEEKAVKIVNKIIPTITLFSVQNGLLTNGKLLCMWELILLLFREDFFVKM